MTWLTRSLPFSGRLVDEPPIKHLLNALDGEPHVSGLEAGAHHAAGQLVQGVIQGIASLEVIASHFHVGGLRHEVLRDRQYGLLHTLRNFTHDTLFFIAIESPRSAHDVRTKI
jgi:hypothetical protein